MLLSVSDIFQFDENLLNAAVIHQDKGVISLFLKHYLISIFRQDSKPHSILLTSDSDI